MQPANSRAGSLGLVAVSKWANHCGAAISLPVPGAASSLPISASIRGCTPRALAQVRSEAGRPLGRQSSIDRGGPWYP